MKSFYTDSSFGWDPPSKKLELFHRLGRFVLVRAGSDTESPIVAFTTFRFERDQDERVVYCYEIQVAGVFRRYGLGKHLMQWLGQIGRGTRMEKVMLTVFKGMRAHNRPVISNTENLKQINLPSSSTEKLVSS